jgi:DNA-binding CsgD family transcriptional regulator
MPSPRLELLRSRDLRAVLTALGDVAEAADSGVHFAQAGLEILARLVPNELTTLSRCDLQTARRTVVAVPLTVIGAAEQAAFDQHFKQHPLVRYHTLQRGAFAHRISDSISFARFCETALYNDYYRRVGLSHALALPVRMDGKELVSFVLNRHGRDFSDTELAMMDAMRRPMARLFERVHAPEERQPPMLSPQTLARLGLTRREAATLQWVGAGKTDRDIAALLACSPRTVHKHLQRVYTKLGVETRTAAVMRVLGHA